MLIPRLARPCFCCTLIPARSLAVLAALAALSTGAAAQICLEPPSLLASNHFDWALAAADFDGDGRPDLAVLQNEYNSVALWRNAGGGNFAAPSVFRTGDLPQGIAVADVDADGDVDIVTANYGTNDVCVFSNSGSGSFALPVRYPALIQPHCVTIADIDGDGDPDLVVGGPNFIGVLRNQGNGSFAPMTSFFSAGSASRVVLADLDADGDLDLVKADSSLSVLVVLKNNGNGTFAAPQALSVGTAQDGVVATDLDADGDLDLATSRSTGASPAVFFNQGGGVFGAAVFLGSGGNAGGICAADLDGDGDPDLVQTGTRVYENLGGGAFAAPLLINAIGWADIAAADFDGDGDLDIAEPRYLYMGTQVLLNCRISGTSFCPGDGTLAACPCSNNGLAGRGCENSSTTGGASLAAGGQRSLASDTLQLSASGVVPNALCILLQGDATIAPASFGDGLRCVGGQLKRLYAHNAGGSALSVPQSGDASVSQRSAALGDTLSAGAVRGYQVYYRDPLLGFCPAPQGDSWNVSSGVSIVWHF